MTEQRSEMVAERGEFEDALLPALNMESHTPRNLGGL